MKTAGAILLLLLFPALVFATDLVNINTADAALLDTLPGIGPTYANRIVDYRALHGPFLKISDIQNVSGIGPSTYSQIAPFITVGDTAPQATTTEATTTAPASGGSATYVPPPAAISLSITGGQDAYLDVPLFLTAKATLKNGAVDPSAQVTWSFGDGSSGTGVETEKIYRYPGTYLIIATALDGSARARDELAVTVGPAQVRIAAVTGDGITLANDSEGRLDLSGWKLLSDVGMFKIPDGTILLPRSSVLFPYGITGLPASFSPVLSYPDGLVAARFTPSAPPQLPSPEEGSHIVQNVIEAPVQAPAETISVSEAAHETTSGLAPAAATDVAAAGAALPPAAASAGLFRSPWTWSLFGVMALAGGAFILL